MKGSSLEAARRNLDAATLLAERGFPREAASRAYYAAFYAAQVALLKEGEETHTHKGIITSFNRVFVRTGRVPTEAGRILAALHRLRLDADLRPMEGGPRAEHP